MNADTLLAALQDGATLRERWKPRTSFNKARKQIILTYPDGKQEIIQRSCLTPLIHRGLVTSIAWSGRFDYVLKQVIE